jgi:hypothetical protein
MQRFNDTKCPDCRQPMFKEVLKDVTRPSPEEVERQRRQSEERARARAEREREEEERARARRLAREGAQGPSLADDEEEDVNVLLSQVRDGLSALTRPEAAPDVTFDANDFAVQWTFFVKGHVPLPPGAIWNAMRAAFAHHMRVEWAQGNAGSYLSWGQRLAVQALHGDGTPTDMPAQTNSLPFTRCRFRLHLPEAVARDFAEWLTYQIGRWGYVTAMDRVLGIRPAVQAGQAVAVMVGVLDEDTDATVAIMNSQENAALNMTWQEYQEWLPFAQRSAPAAAPAPAPAPAPATAGALVEYEPLQDVTDFAVQWTLLIKGHIPTDERIWSTIRAFFAHHMFREWAPHNPVEDWGRHLGIAVRHGDVAPYSATHASMRIRFTRCRFRMYLPEAVARRFAEWLTVRIENRGYGEAMDEVLGIRGAIKAGPANGVAVAVMTGMYDEDTQETQNLLQVHEISTPAMTWQEYQAWPHFEYRSAAAAAPSDPPGAGQLATPAPAPAASMPPPGASAASDPIATMRPVGGADTDITIRWRFWLKGWMSGVQRADNVTHWRRAFADTMRPWMTELRTSADPWFDRLWVWTHAEEPRITGPRTGLQLSDGITRRCEFALRLPYPLSSNWIRWVEQELGSTTWNELAKRWFYVEPVLAVESRDKPHIAPPGDTLYPLVGAPSMTEAEYNAWDSWRNVQRFFSIGETRH